MQDLALAVVAGVACKLKCKFILNKLACMCVNEAHSMIVCHGDCLCILCKGAVGGGPELQHLRPSSLCLLSAGELREAFCGGTALL